MSTSSPVQSTPVPPADAPGAPGRPARRSPRPKARTSLLAHGQPLVWLNGGALAVCLVMIVGLLALVFYQGMGTFWPVPAVEVHTVQGRAYLGEIIRENTYRPDASVIAALPPKVKPQVESALAANGGLARRRLFRTANFDLTQTRQHWVNDFEITQETRPDWALIVERTTNDGRFIGIPKAFLTDGKEVATEPALILAQYEEHSATVRQRVEQREKLKRKDIGAVSRKSDDARLALKQAEMDHGRDSVQYGEAEERYREISAWAAGEQSRLQTEIGRLDKENSRYKMRLESVDGKQKDLPLADILRLYPANQLGYWDRMEVYLARWWEFLSDEPRAINTEGGVFPAIWGTAAMTLLMSVAVVPFGVLAALYLREYARAGPIVSAVRIAVNNLAGVPSIVFGVFGLGFFCYIIGGSIDDLFFRAKLPSPTYGTGGLLWAAFTLALLTLPVVIVATEEALAAVPRSMREGSYACGASKWQTIRRIVLPRAMPGILTGTILAMARGAGEVAPLMLVGASKWTSRLPVDDVFPYIHPERSFMHLGFHIYDVGFQSPDSEAAQPLVFTTTLLLVALIAALNATAMLVRNLLRKRYVANQF
ncbi:MAG: phosphate ABC transporter permease PstA [Planctomycetota bacterium]|nr:MAG: phosphate ABC transporter permease PstA [Planctomycetota bacterium]